jgi:NTE family protein
MGWLQTAVERVRGFAYAERPIAPEVPRARPKIGLALGGGFARGIAHAGVLHVLEQQHIPIDYIAGTSAGALAGISYAARMPFEEIATKAAALRFSVFGQWRFSRMGLASNQRLEHYAQRYFGVSTFEELKIPLAITATDLLTGQPFYFTHGLLGPALRASCAYPGLFQPVEYEGRMLVDGFVGATVPVDAVRKMGADIVIAVFLDAESATKPANFTDVIGRCFSIIQRHADLDWRAKADVIIEPNVREFAWDDFAKTPQLIAAGETAALDAVGRIRTALQAGAAQPKPEESPRMASLPTTRGHG